MDVANVRTIGRKELRDARRNRWLHLYAASFALLALALAWVGTGSSFGAGVASLGRTGASLVNLVLLLVPLLGLVLGALALAGERDRGTLLCLLAQPVVAGEILAGKFLGLAAALVAALSFGFGVAGAVIAWNAGAAEVGSYLGLVGLAFLLATASLGLGFLISVLSRAAAAAVGTALFAWLLLVFLGDLGVMASAVTLRFDVETLLGLALLNPLEVFRVAAVLVLQGGGEALGPAGTFAVDSYGRALLPFLVGLLALWTAVPLALSWVQMRRRGAL